MAQIPPPGCGGSQHADQGDVQAGFLYLRAT
jgi:hypothetical protein